MVSPLEIFIFTKVASTFTLVVSLVLILFFLLKNKAKQKAISLLVSSFVLFTTVTVAKGYFQVARPTDSLITTSGYAFPSGHAAGVVFLAIVVSFLSRHLSFYYRYLVWGVSIFTAGAISYSRLFFHVHTWFQVLVGVGIGMMCGFLFMHLSTRITK